MHYFAISARQLIYPANKGENRCICKTTIVQLTAKTGLITYINCSISALQTSDHSSIPPPRYSPYYMVERLFLNTNKLLYHITLKHRKGSCYDEQTTPKPGRCARGTESGFVCYLQEDGGGGDQSLVSRYVAEQRIGEFLSACAGHHQPAQPRDLPSAMCYHPHGCGALSVADQHSAARYRQSEASEGSRQRVPEHHPGAMGRIKNRKRADAANHTEHLLFTRSEKKGI